MNPDTALITEALEAIAADRAAPERERHAVNLDGLLRNMARFGNRRGDPVRMIQGYLGDRWSSLVMHLLRGGMLRFTELRRLIAVVSAEHGISQRMLTLKLRVLERDGLVMRNVSADVPPRVEYRLTALGLGAYERFSELVRWSEMATPLIRAARGEYDRLHPDSAAMLRQADQDDSGD